jgi:D-amino-acid dehydrogenase
METSQTHDAVVIGAGIVGVMTALYLQQDGRSVTLIERDDVAAGASAGNAGVLAYPEIIPIASPGMIWKAPKWLLDPLGPLSIRPSYALKLAPWLYRFWRSSSRSQFERTIGVQAAMMKLAAAEMQTTTSNQLLNGFVSNTGTLDIYESAASLEAAHHDWDARAKAGSQFRRVGRDEIESLQPGLADNFRHAYYSPNGLQIGNPKDFTKAVAELAFSSGVRFEKGSAVAIKQTPDGAEIKLSGGRSLSARCVVVACGAWSKNLAAELGDFIPLDTERGYNTTLPVAAFDLKRQLFFNDHGFVVTPLSDGVRVGGAVELAGLDLPPDYRRSDAMLTKAKRFLPALETRGGTQWMGFRPSTPDCLPVIGPSTRTPAVVYAFGHGHLGLTQSAATARIVSDMVAGRASALPVNPFSPSRFR